MCGIRFIAVQQAVAYLVMVMACHLYLSCKVMLVYQYRSIYKRWYCWIEAIRKTQLKIICTYLSFNKSVMVYYNLDENMWNDILPAKKNKKRSSIFPKVFSGEFLRNINRLRKLIFQEFYLTLFQIALLLCIIANSIKIPPTDFSVHAKTNFYKLLSHLSVT